MYCSNCGIKIEKNCRYCPKCGININNTKKDNANHIIKEINLEEVYIGSEYNKLKEDKFSVATLIFGPIYFLYRKMWLYGILWLLCYFLVRFIGIKNTNYLLFITNIVFAFNFKKLYFYHIKKKIFNIKNNSSEKEAIDLIKKKGGTSFIPIILFILFLIVRLFILIFYHAYILFTKEFNNVNKKLYETILKYDIPSSFKKDLNNEFYQYNDQNNICSFNVIKSQDNDSVSNKFKEFMMMNIDKNVSEIQTTNINGNVWKYVVATKDSTKNYYYVTTYGKNTYLISFYIAKDDNFICSKAHDDFINSLKFTNMNNSI